MKQWEEVVEILFKNIPRLIVSGGVEEESISQFVKNNKKFIMITTYASSYKVLNAIQTIQFDLKILDEVHHLTTPNATIQIDGKKYIQILNIKSRLQLSLTATIKQIESEIDNLNVISNDNVLQFGEVIDRKCLLWAIKENIICDYVLQTIVTDEDQLTPHLSKFSITNDNEKRLFLSAFCALKSIFMGSSHHLLIYTNNKNNSLKLVQYIKAFLSSGYFVISQLYYSTYNSGMHLKHQQEIINKFENSKFGIISCVYCLGEGWDFPLLDGVVFAENMTSNIRITQSALRASRKDKNNPSKITKIILPILNKDNWLEDSNNCDLKSVIEIIRQISLEDNTIIQKIKAYKIDIIKHDWRSVAGKDTQVEIENYDDALTQRLRLKTTSRSSISISYSMAKKIIADYNVKNKKSYYDLCNIDHRLDKDPETTFKQHFINWVDYLSLERIYYDLQMCKEKVREYLTYNAEIKNNHLNLNDVCIELCKIDNLFPPNDLWCDYYGVNNLWDIINIDIKRKSIIDYKK